MNPRNRDLLVLTKKEKLNQQELEQEIALLNDLFFRVESSEAYYIANEVIDVNRYKLITKLHKVKQILKEHKHKPFVFISNKN
ncbi:hypothetical protein [Parafilimonas sp.]|jgi:hypothetical protein|uniref:hypothetical protein n=1 Tax=Parafilimonas sp. TaxID=1969739 RepID=UPI003F7F4627